MGMWGGVCVCGRGGGGGVGWGGVGWGGVGWGGVGWGGVGWGGESETFRVYLADPAGQGGISIKILIPSSDLPKSQKLNKNIKREKTKNKTTFFGKKKKTHGRTAAPP